MKTQSRPFTVTVKRQKRSKGASIWSDTPNMADMLAEASTGEEAAGADTAPSGTRQSAAASPASAKAQTRKAKTIAATGPERRILADLTPVELPVAEAEPEQQRRPRGRPRKARPTYENASDSAALSPVPSAAEPAFGAGLSEPVKQPVPSRRPRREPVRPSAVAISQALAFDDAGEPPAGTSGSGGSDDAGVTLDTAATADLGGPIDDAGHAPRRRTGVSLRRGERWKRHLPRWKR